MAKSVFPAPISGSSSPSPAATARVRSSYPARLPPDASADARHVHLGRQLRMYELLVAGVCDAIVVTDHKGDVTLFNPAAEALFGRSFGDMEGSSIFECFEECDRASACEVVLADIRAGRATRDLRVVVTRPDGTRAITLLNVNPMMIGQGHLVRVVGLFRDVTELERKNEELSRLNAELSALVTTDQKTGLLNERGFLAELTRASRQARRFGESLSLLYLDLTKFKAINDVYGHEAGDAAIREFGRRLREALYSTDIVARLHGDEYAVILPHTDAAALRSVVEKLLPEIIFYMRFRPKDGGDVTAVTIKAAIGGVVRVGRNIPGEDELLRLADLAMYESKQGGQFFALDLDAGSPTNSVPPSA